MERIQSVDYHVNGFGLSTAKNCSIGLSYTDVGTCYRYHNLIQDTREIYTYASEFCSEYKSVLWILNTSGLASNGPGVRYKPEAWQWSRITLPNFFGSPNLGLFRAIFGTSFHKEGPYNLLCFQITRSFWYLFF